MVSNDYEIVFDHLQEDSIPDHSYEMEEQPTLMMVEEFQLHQQLSHHVSVLV